MAQPARRLPTCYPGADERFVRRRCCGFCYLSMTGVLITGSAATDAYWLAIHEACLSQPRKQILSTRSSPSSSQAPRSVGAVSGSMVGVADRMRRPGRAAIDAVAVSWTIRSEDDGASSIGLLDG
jgi:hypothetical protein